MGRRRRRVSAIVILKSVPRPLLSVSLVKAPPITELRDFHPFGVVVAVTACLPDPSSSRVGSCAFTLDLRSRSALADGVI